MCSDRILDLDPTKMTKMLFNNDDEIMVHILDGKKSDLVLLSSSKQMPYTDQITEISPHVCTSS